MHGYKSLWGNHTSGITGDFWCPVNSGKFKQKDLDADIRLCLAEFYQQGCSGLQCQVSTCWYSSSTYKSCHLGRNAARRRREGKCLCLPTEQHGDGTRGVWTGHPHPCLSICCREGLFLGRDGGLGLNCLPPVRKTIALMMIFLMGVPTASKSGVILPAHFIQIIR